MGMQDRDWYRDHHRELHRREREAEWRLPRAIVGGGRLYWFVVGASSFALFERFVLPWLMRR